MFCLEGLIIPGYRIFRGYKELCNAADRLPDVTHAVFVVHGVGGVMDEGTIGRNATLMRDNVSHILTKCFPKFQEQSGQRVEFFPVEWRTNLRLDEGLVDAITPQRVMGLRFSYTPSEPSYSGSKHFPGLCSTALRWTSCTTRAPSSGWRSGAPSSTN